VCQPRARAQDRDNLRTYWSVRLAYGPAAWSVGDRRGCRECPRCSTDNRSVLDPSISGSSSISGSARKCSR